MRYVFAVLLCSAAAFEGTGRIYNLADGSITILKYNRWHGDHGPLTATMPSGEALAGEYSITRGGSAESGSIYSSVYGTVAIRTCSPIAEHDINKREKRHGQAEQSLRVKRWHPQRHRTVRP
jgi:hypothetical protein